MFLIVIFFNFLLPVMFSNFGNLSFSYVFPSGGHLSSCDLEFKFYAKKQPWDQVLSSGNLKSVPKITKIWLNSFFLLIGPWIEFSYGVEKRCHFFKFSVVALAVFHVFWDTHRLWTSKPVWTPWIYFAFRYHKIFSRGKERCIRLWQEQMRSLLSLSPVWAL